MKVRTSSVVAACALVVMLGPAAAAEGNPEPAVTGLTEAPASTTAPAAININYIQYGVAFTGEFVTSPGPLCDSVPAGKPAPPCILGSGGGVAVRVGWRSAGPWLFGGAYELSKQSPNSLYRLAILQQLRGEARYYIHTGRDTTPYLSGGGGFAGYGNEGGLDTLGFAAFASIGTETQISRRTVFGVGLAYRLLYLQGYQDPAGNDRAAGVSQMLGFDLLLEARDPL